MSRNRSRGASICVSAQISSHSLSEMGVHFPVYVSQLPVVEHLFPHPTLRYVEVFLF